MWLHIIGFIVDARRPRNSPDVGWCIGCVHWLRMSTYRQSRNNHNPRCMQEHMYAYVQDGYCLLLCRLRIEYVLCTVCSTGLGTQQAYIHPFAMTHLGLCAESVFNSVPLDKPAGHDSGRLHSSHRAPIKLPVFRWLQIFNT